MLVHPLQKNLIYCAQENYAGQMLERLILKTEETNLNMPPPKKKLYFG